MAWLPKVNLGNLGDLAGAVNKFSEQVKSLERNFDSALGFEDGSAKQAEPEAKPSPSLSEEKQPSRIWSSPLTSASTSPLTSASPHPIDNVPSLTLSATDERVSPVAESLISDLVGQSKQIELGEDETGACGERDRVPVLVATIGNNVQLADVANANQLLNIEAPTEILSGQGVLASGPEDKLKSDKEVLFAQLHTENGSSPDMPGTMQAETILHVSEKGSTGMEVEMYEGLVSDQEVREKAMIGEVGQGVDNHSMAAEEDRELGNGLAKGAAISSPVKNVVAVNDSQVQQLQDEKNNLEAVLQSAARQSQAKADEIGRLTSQVDQLKAELDDVKLNGEKRLEAELEALREEYQHRLGAAERKVYALTKERDRLQREQGRKTDTSTLLKEKDEIIKQVMAEGEELSKKQANQELAMKKLRTQIRDMEEEKQRLLSRVQVEEARVESIKKDKAKTERDLQESVERGQAELAAQKDFYSSALAEAKEALANAEARIDSEARADTERRLREAGEREKQLLAALEDMRASLARTERDAEHREGLLRRDIEALEARCQEAEVRHEELVSRMPDSTRPLLRQIEAMQELTSMHVEARAGVERTLNARLLEAEGKCAAAEERERASNERLTQVLSRLAVMEAQLSMLRAEHAGLARSLEKERTRASENRQDFLAASEEAATHEGHSKQLEEEMRVMRDRTRKEVQEERARREALEREIEVERKALAEYEKRVRAEGRIAADKAVAVAQAAGTGLTDGTLSRSSSGLPRRHSGTSTTNMEESHFLQVSLQGSGANLSSFVPRPETPLSPQRSFARGGVTVDQLEAMLRSKEGEIASHQLRLAALESTRDSLAEELVNTTTQCEHLRAEVSSVPGMRAELDALRRRHTSALELMGERDEQVEELKADLADVKQMYREQIDLLVNQIERIGAQMNGIGR